MNNEIKARVNFQDVAAYLAHAGDNEQAEFLNIFATELKTVCETHFHFETQGHHIRELLNPTAVELIQTIGYEEVTP